MAGAALGGVLAVTPGPRAVYLLDAVSFAVSLGFLRWLGPVPAPPAAGDVHRTALRGLLPGLRYARSRPELVGSYLVDLAAMTLAYPNALFPFIAADLHASWAVGLMFVAPSVGAAAASALSGWTGRVRRHGRAIALAAAAWGLAITGLGLAPDIGAALAFLVLAGCADMLSGIFRDTLWNQTVPDALRGRMAGVELLSYGLGPSAGQVRAGGVASLTTPAFSAWSGGLLCVAAVAATCAALPGFVRYRADAPPCRSAGSSLSASETAR
jgi:MFS family permease